MPACARFPRPLRRSSLLVGAALALTVVAAPAFAHEDPNADVPVESTYTVQQGDFLAEIAEEHDLDSWTPLYALNHQEIDSPDLLMVGQELDIPADPQAVDVSVVEPIADAEPSGSTEQSQPELQAQTTTSASPDPQPEPEPTQSASGSVWDSLAQCESNGNWSINTGNGFYGGLQFHPQTWASFGGHQYAPNAHLASRAQEIAIAERVLASQGWGAWPSCSSQLGLS